MSEDEIEHLAAEDEDSPPTDESHWAEATVYVPPSKVALRRDMEAQQVKKAGR